MKDFSKVIRWDIYATYAEFEEDTVGDWVKYDDYVSVNVAYEEQVRENAALKKLLGRAHERLDELKQPVYTGTGSDYLDCVLGVGGFESFGPITGDEK